jgi:hypothetical protein
MYKQLLAFIFTAFTLTAWAQEKGPTFRLTNWGDSKAEVQALEDSRLYLDRPDLLIYQQEAYGVQMLIKYLFEDDSLYAANYVVIEDFDYNDNTWADYEEVRKTAIWRLGDPDEESYPPKEKDFNGFLDANGIYAVWDKPRSDVRLQMIKDSIGYIYIEVLVNAK